MSKRINLIFTWLFISLFLSQTFLFAQDSCETLELKLIELKDKRAEAIAALQKNDRGLMQAQEILLLSRAKGDAKAGQVAEEAIKRFETNISKNKAAIKECEEEIARIENVLRLCSGDECNTIESKINRTKEALKRTIEDARRQSEEYEDLQKELETLMGLQNELKRLDTQIEFILNTIDTTGAFSSIQMVKKLKESIALSAAQFGKDNIELMQTLKNEAERIARLLEEAKIAAEGLKNDINLTRKFLDAGLDLSDLASKIMKAKNVFERAVKLNNLLKVNEYVYKTLYINVGYDLLGEELSARLYATDKTMEAVEALKRELKREMEIYKTCKELGRLK